MANTTEHVRELIATERTPGDKGLEMTMKVVAYDTGIVTVNGTPIGQNVSDPWLSAARLVVQMLEEFEMEAARQRTNAA
jgi:hypothetical protein